MTAPELFADETDERFLDGLRQRRLFTLAESFCRDRLANGKLSPMDAARLAVERIRALAEHASNSPPDARGPLVDQTRRISDEFVRQNGASSRCYLVRLQDALTSLAIGELARLEEEVGGAGGEQARQRLREATRLLEVLEKDLSQTIGLRARKPVVDDELSLDELTSLANNIRFQHARALRNQALCYPPGSDDRVAALALSVEPLEKLRQQLSADDPLAWRVRLDTSTCRRLQGRWDDARELLMPTEFVSSPPALRQAARAEFLRLLLAEANLSEAEKMLGEGRDVNAPRSADWDFAVLEALVALWQAADKSQNQAMGVEWQKRTLAALQQIDQAHGPYWRRRGELLLVRSASTSRSDTNVEILARSADSLYLQGQFDEAIAAYEKAAGMLNSAKEVERRFDLLYKAALIEQKRKNFASAIKRLAELSLANKSLPKASDAHLLAAWLAAQEIRAAPQDKSTICQYQSLLEEQLAAWPMAASSQQARLWLGSFHESRQVRAAALAAYSAIPRDAKPFEEAMLAAARCWPPYLAELRSAGKDTSSATKDAVDFFRASLQDGTGKWLMNWNDSQRDAALAWARIQIEYVPSGHAEAEQVVRAAITNSAGATVTWKSAAQALLVIAVAGQKGRDEDAAKLLDEMTDGSPLQMLDLVRSLGTLAATAGNEGRVSLAKMQLRVIDQLLPRSSTLREAERTQLEILRADALVATGRRDDAVSAFDQLAKRLPNDGPVQEKYATLLLDGATAASWRRALDQWRLVASKSPPRTPQWFRAKYSVALAQYKLDEKKSAAQMIRFLAETPPGLDGTNLKPQFLDLLKKCEAGSGASTP